MTSDYGPKTAFGQQIFAEKYSFRGEDYRSMANRVAATLSDGSDHYHAVRELVGTQKFLHAGRILGGAGTSKSVCLHNCFVSGRIEDSYVDGPGSIMQRAHEAATTMRMGGGIGYDFSTLRPRGSLIKRLDSNATGPVSFMEIFNSVGLATCSSGHRRGAQMGVLRVDHPDIFEFVQAKQTPGRLTGFNISVGVTNEFMLAVEFDLEFPLRWGGETYRTIKARELWELIMRAAWDWAEPGVLFLDRMNSDNNLAYCETIEATNPCSEQPLPAYGACLLGSFNLAKFVKQNPLFPLEHFFDWDAFRSAIPDAVRSMDLVNDVAFYPLREQRVEALSKRRLGIGVMGLANAIEACGRPYGSKSFLAMADEMLHILKNEAYRASAKLAAEKGAFPLYKEEYLDSPFIQRLDGDVIKLIRKYGIRNSHLISMAPTGTIAQLCDNVSGGIEPTFEKAYTRDAIFPTGTVTTVVEDYGVIAFGNNPRTADEVTAEEHVAVLTCAQAHTDSAVSKTCNVTGDMEWDAFKDIYFQAWKRGAKGCTVFNKDGKRMGVLRDLPAVEADSSTPGCVSGLCEL